LTDYKNCGLILFLISSRFLFVKLFKLKKGKCKIGLVFRFKNILTISIKSFTFLSIFLVAPNGKILSMSRQERGETNLRGKDLLTTLDKILPKK